MRIRATLLAALVVMLGASLGETADYRDRYDLVLALGDIDTADHIGVDAADSTNDSILAITSQPFGIPPTAYSMIVRLVETTKDTLLDNDSLIFDVQTKLNHAYDSCWYRVGGSTLIDDDGTMNTVGATCRVALDSDSLMSLNDIGRVRLWIVASPTTYRASDVSGILQFNAVYEALVRFKLR